MPLYPGVGGDGSCLHGSSRGSGGAAGSCCNQGLSFVPHCYPGDRRSGWTRFQHHVTFMVSPQAVFSGAAWRSPLWCLAGWMWSASCQTISMVPDNRQKLQRWESSPRGRRRQPDGLLDFSSFLNFYKHKKKLDKATGL